MVTVIVDFPNSGQHHVAMATVPHVGETISYNGFTYRVAHVRHTVLKGDYPLNSHVLIKLEEA